jgi:hypothetical protein
VLKKFKLSADYGTQNAVHRQVKSRIIVFYRTDALFSANFCRKLLPDFAHDALFRRFVRFDFSAGKLPPSAPVAISALGCK